MFNIFCTSIRLDFCYAINSFIYHLKRTPILKNIIPDHLYQKRGLKTFVRILSSLCTGFRMILSRFLYVSIIYYLASVLSKNHLEDTFFHIFFFFSLIGLFINTNILNTSRRKYVSIILFQMDARGYTLSYLIYGLLSSFLLNLFILGGFALTFHFSFQSVLLVSFFSIFTRIIGEAYSVFYYKKHQIRFIGNLGNYFLVVGIGFLCAFLLPYLGILISFPFMMMVTLIFFFLFLFCFSYLFHISDYKLIYQRLNQLNQVMSSDANALTHDLVALREKDKKISPRKLRGKKGYDLFNTIFFERHKYLLLKSSRFIAILILSIFFILLLIIFKEPMYKEKIYQLIKDHFSWIVLLTYFLNRGEVITKAMFFNCDHSMLTFNFYRHPDVILQLFKKRLLMVIKINMIPSLALGICLPLILCFTGGFSFFSGIGVFLLVVILSIFFSVHYLGLYYLLQPYSKDLKMKSANYSLCSMIIYFLCYLITYLSIPIPTFVGIGIFVTMIYIILILSLVGKKSFYTFHLK